MTTGAPTVGPPTSRTGRRVNQSRAPAHRRPLREAPINNLIILDGAEQMATVDRTELIQPSRAAPRSGR